jgi:outer membrane receptor for ferrienterochelin and colicins
MKKIALTLIGIFVPVLVMAQFGSIEGTVIDMKTQKPLAMVDVIVKGTSLGAAAGIDGKYVIADITAGDYSITATMMGYKAVTKKVKVLPGKTTYLDFNLKESVIELGGIVVTGTRTPRYIKDIPVRTEVITAQAIEEKGAGTIYEALDGSPGIRVEQQCQYCNFSMVRLQGLGPDHTQVLIDGQPVYSGLASVYGLQQLATANVDRIEVVKGAGSALYGSGAVAGGINIITKKPSQKSEVEVGIELGTYDTNKYDFTASTRKDNIGVSFFAQKQGGDAIDQTGDGDNADEVKKSDGISDRVKTDATDAGFSVVVDSIFGNDQVTVAGKALHELRQGGTLDDDTYENPFTEGTERILTNRYEVETTYGKQFLYGNQVNITFAYAHHYRNATNDTYLGDYMATHGDTLPPLDYMRPYLATENLYALNLNYLHPLFGKHRLLAGVQYSHNRLEEMGRYVVVDEDDENYGEPYTSTSEKHADEAGIYLQDEFSASDVFELVVGARYDYHKSEDNFRGSGKVAPEGVPPVEYDETALNPRFAVKYELFPFFTLRGSVGTGFRVPYGFSEDLHLCSGSPRVWKGGDLKPEKSVGFNLSLDYEMADRLFINVNLFRTNLENKIGFVEAGEMAKSLGYTYEWKNIDNAYVQGLELGGSLLLMQNFVLDADFTFNDGQYEHEREDWIGTSYEKDSKYISRFPRYTAGAKLSFTPEDWSFVLDGDYQGPMYIDYFMDEEEPTIIKETEPYLLLNAKVSRNLFDRFSLFVGAKNLTDYIQPEKHTDDAAFMYAPVYGRIVYGGVKLKI